MKRESLSHLNRFVGAASGTCHLAVYSPLMICGSGVKAFVQRAGWPFFRPTDFAPPRFVNATDYWGVK